MAQCLIVEGKDGIVLTNILMKYIQKTPPKGYETSKKYKRFVKEAGGFDNVEKTLLEILEKPDFTNIGLVVDADFKGVTHRLAQVEAMIKNIFQLHQLDNFDLTQNGVIWKYEQLTLGIWIMPDNQSNGYLEHFVATMINEDDKLWSFAKEKTDELTQTDFCPFTEVKYQKAYLQTFLAWQKNPGLPMGTAIQAKYLPNKSPLTNRFVTWFKNTFELEE